MRKELWFGLGLMAAFLAAIVVLMPPPDQITSPHLGLLMLALIVAAIMLGFPTAFTLMGLLAFPAMLRAGYGVRLSAGVITAGGCLGILIPPSVMLILYGATAGVSVVQLYAGAFFPGLMLAGLYILYVIVLAVVRPSLAPPLSAEERRVKLSASLAALYLKGVAPPHVTLNQIFAGVQPFMAIQVLAIVLLYLFPQIGLWLPSWLYG